MSTTQRIKSWNATTIKGDADAFYAMGDDGGGDGGSVCISRFSVSTPNLYKLQNGRHSGPELQACNGFASKFRNRIDKALAACENLFISNVRNDMLLSTDDTLSSSTGLPLSTALDKCSPSSPTQEKSRMYFPELADTHDNGLCCAPNRVSPPSQTCNSLSAIDHNSIPKRSNTNGHFEIKSQDRRDTPTKHSLTHGSTHSISNHGILEHIVRPISNSIKEKKHLNRCKIIPSLKSFHFTQTPPPNAEHPAPNTLSNTVVVGSKDHTFLRGASKKCKKTSNKIFRVGSYRKKMALSNHPTLPPITAEPRSIQEIDDQSNATHPSNPALAMNPVPESMVEVDPGIIYSKPQSPSQSVPNRVCTNDFFHCFVPICCSTPSLTCSICNKTMVDKLALQCQNCLLTVHDIETCRQTVPRCPMRPHSLSLNAINDEIKRALARRLTVSKLATCSEKTFDPNRDNEQPYPTKHSDDSLLRSPNLSSPKTLIGMRANSDGALHTSPNKEDHVIPMKISLFSHNPFGSHDKIVAGADLPPHPIPLKEGIYGKGHSPGYSRSAHDLSFVATSSVPTFDNGCFDGECLNKSITYIDNSVVENLSDDGPVVANHPVLDAELKLAEGHLSSTSLESPDDGRESEFPEPLLGYPNGDTTMFYDVLEHLKKKQQHDRRHHGDTPCDRTDAAIPLPNIVLSSSLSPVSHDPPKFPNYPHFGDSSKDPSPVRTDNLVFAHVIHDHVDAPPYDALPRALVLPSDLTPDHHHHQSGEGYDTDPPPPLPPHVNDKPPHPIPHSISNFPSITKDVFLNFDSLNPANIDAWAKVRNDKKTTKELNSKEIKRQDIIHELILTEKLHIQTLSIIQKIYAFALNKTLNVDQNIVDRIFPRISGLYDIHTAFYESLNRRQNQAPIVANIGDVLVGQFTGQNGDVMKREYGIFCSLHKTAIATYKQLVKSDKNNQSFMQEALSHPLCRRKSIPECILAVTQRITKYPIFLESIIKANKSKKIHTHDDELVIKALDGLKSVLTHVDEQINLKELEQRLVEICAKIETKSYATFEGEKFWKTDLLPSSPWVESSDQNYAKGGAREESKRRLIFEGTSPLEINYAGLSGVAKGKQSCEVCAIIMTDIVVFLQENGGKYSFASGDNMSAVLSLKKLLVREKAGDATAFYIINCQPTAPEMYEITCENAKGKNQWLFALRKAISQASIRHINETEVNKQTSQIDEDIKKMNEKYAKVLKWLGEAESKDRDVNALLAQKNLILAHILDCVGRKHPEVCPNVVRLSLEGTELLGVKDNAMSHSTISYAERSSVEINKRQSLEVNVLEKLISQNGGDAIPENNYRSRSPLTELKEFIEASLHYLYKSSFANTSPAINLNRSVSNVLDHRRDLCSSSNHTFNQPSLDPWLTSTFADLQSGCQQPKRAETFSGFDCRAPTSSHLQVLTCPDPASLTKNGVEDRALNHLTMRRKNNGIIHESNSEDYASMVNNDTELNKVNPTTCSLDSLTFSISTTSSSSSSSTATTNLGSSKTSQISSPISSINTSDLSLTSNYASIMGYEITNDKLKMYEYVGDGSTFKIKTIQSFNYILGIINQEITQQARLLAENNDLQNRVNRYENEKTDRKSQMWHNQQLEELRNLQESVSKEREALKRDSEAEKAAIRAEKKFVENQMEQLNAMRERLRADQELILTQKNTIQQYWADVMDDHGRRAAIATITTSSTTATSTSPRPTKHHAQPDIPIPNTYQHGRSKSYESPDFASSTFATNNYYRPIPETTVAPSSPSKRSLSTKINRHSNSATLLKNTQLNSRTSKNRATTTDINLTSNKTPAFPPHLISATNERKLFLGQPPPPSSSSSLIFSESSPPMRDSEPERNHLHDRGDVNGTLYPAIPSGKKSFKNSVSNAKLLPLHLSSTSALTDLHSSNANASGTSIGNKKGFVPPHQHSTSTSFLGSSSSFSFKKFQDWRESNSSSHHNHNPDRHGQETTATTRFQANNANGVGASQRHSFFGGINKSAPAPQIQPKNLVVSTTKSDGLEGKTIFIVETSSTTLPSSLTTTGSAINAGSTCSSQSSHQMLPLKLASGPRRYMSQMDQLVESDTEVYRTGGSNDLEDVTRPIVTQTKTYLRLPPTDSYNEDNNDDTTSYNRSVTATTQNQSLENINHKHELSNNRCDNVNNSDVNNGNAVFTTESSQPYSPKLIQSIYYF